MDSNKQLQSLEQSQQKQIAKRSQQKLRQPKRAQKDLTRSQRAENIDTIGQKSPKLIITTLITLGVLAAAALGVSSQLRVSNESKPNSSEPSLVNAPPAVSDKSGNEQILVQQAQLLANQAQPQQLAEAITILRQVPAAAAVNSQGESLTKIWGQQILNLAQTQATGGDLSGAIATAQLIPTNSETHQLAQNQVTQWQQQQQQASQQQFAAELAQASKPLPVKTPVLSTPAPKPTPKIANNAAIANTTQTQSSSQSQIAPATKAEPTTQPQLATANTTTTKVKVATPPKQPNPNQAKLQAQDPYLNVKINPVNVPQLQKKPVINRVATNTGSGGNFGFQNLTVYAPTVAIRLRDNVDEDGDFVSLIVNGKVYAENELIVNRGRVMFVDLQPGENRVDIVGVKDGEGGITLEVDVAGVGNLNRRPIPEGQTASFIINRVE